MFSECFMSLELYVAVMGKLQKEEKVLRRKQHYSLFVFISEKMVATCLAQFSINT